MYSFCIVESDEVSTCSTDSSKSVQWNTMNKGSSLVNTLKYFKTEHIVCRVQGSVLYEVMNIIKPLLWFIN